MKIEIRTILAPLVWPIRQEVMWPDEPLDYVKLPNDEIGLHYGLFENQELISVVSLFIENREAQFRKFATRVNRQGKGYGSQLLSYMINEAQSHGIDRLWCNARLDKTSFYHKFGLKETAHSFVRNGQSYVVMEKLILH